MTSFSDPVSHALAMLLASSWVRGSLLYWSEPLVSARRWEDLGHAMPVEPEAAKLIEDRLMVTALDRLVGTVR